jgi:hypothetical protein
MKLKCVISGKEVNVSPKVFQDRATKYGVDPEKLKVGYISRESKRLLREGKSVDEIRLASGIQGLNPVDQSILDTVLNKKTEDVAS